MDFFNFLSYSSLNLRYVYETQNTSFKYAVLTGFDYGIFIHKINFNTNYNWVGRYNIGFRIVKARSGLLFDINIPLHNVEACCASYNSKEQIYPGITIGLSYVLFDLSREDSKEFKRRLKEIQEYKKMLKDLK